MMIRETVKTGAPVKACADCGAMPTFGVYVSAAGYYVGYACCQPFSRESKYYPTRRAAELAAMDGSYAR